jgi:hypothetical protein
VASTVIAAIFTAITALVAIFAIRSAQRSSTIAIQATLLKDFMLEFDNLAEARFVTSSRAIERIKCSDTPQIVPAPPQLWYLIDFFDKLAMYMKRGYLDKEMMVISFLYWIIPYWTFFYDDIQKYMSETPLAMWHEVPRQIAVLERVAVTLDMTLENLADSRMPTHMENFFLGEIDDCRPTAGIGKPRGRHWLRVASRGR